jgi:hypothetical protein
MAGSGPLKCTILGFCAAALICSLGCNSNGMVDLAARVTLDGQPVPGASVTLYGQGSTRNRPASGISNEAGVVEHFTTFHPNDGVLPGEYKAIVMKMPKSKEEEIAHFDPNDPQDVQRLMARERSSNVNFTPTVLPRIYLDPSQSPLACKVPSEGREVVFALNSSAGKPAK